MSHLTFKLGHSGPKCKWDKSGTFFRIVAVHFASPSQNGLKLKLILNLIDLKHSYICPILKSKKKNEELHVTKKEKEN